MILYKIINAQRQYMLQGPKKPKGRSCPQVEHPKAGKARKEPSLKAGMKKQSKSMNESTKVGATSMTSLACQR